MPSLDNWLRGTQDGLTIGAETIQKRDLVEITIARGTSDLDPQCVRVVPSRGGSESGETQGNNVPSASGVVVIGDDDLNIRKGDLFVFRSTRYKVIYVMSAVAGHVQAYAEGTQ
jgi:hypothetical protein